jgi:hypothetical protein
VRALAALVAAAHPDWTSGDVKEQLRSSARRAADMGRQQWSEAYGSGLLDVAAALS